MAFNDPVDPPTDRRRGGGLGTGAFDKVVRLVEGDRKRDAEQQRATVRILGSLLALSLLVNAVLVAGIVGVGVSGRVPGLGEVTITKPDTIPLQAPLPSSPRFEELPGSPPGR